MKGGDGLPSFSFATTFQYGTISYNLSTLSNVVKGSRAICPRAFYIADKHNSTKIKFVNSLWKVRFYRPPPFSIALLNP